MYRLLTADNPFKPRTILANAEDTALEGRRVDQSGITVGLSIDVGGLGGFRPMRHCPQPITLEAPEIHGFVVQATEGRGLACTLVSDSSTTREVFDTKGGTFFPSVEAPGGQFGLWTSNLNGNFRSLAKPLRPTQIAVYRFVTNTVVLDGPRARNDCFAEVTQCVGQVHLVEVRIHQVFGLMVSE